MINTPILLPTTDVYGDVVNSSDTYKWVAIEVQRKASLIIGWTDQQGTHYDILFALPRFIENNRLQGGLSGLELFVSVVRVGCFGFEIKENADTHKNYYEEKIGLGSDEAAELINNVRSELAKIHTAPTGA